MNESHTDDVTSYDYLYNSNISAADYEFDFHDRMRRFFGLPHVILMLVLGLAGIAMNILSLLALFQIRNRMNSHYRLIVSLSSSDLLIGLSILLISINKVLNPLFLMRGTSSQRLRSSCFHILLRALHNTSLIISLLNLMGMSIDHYIAITKPLHYPKLMNGRRVRFMIYTLWIIAFLCGYSNAISGLFHRADLNTNVTLNICEEAYLSKFQEEYIMMFISVVCLVVMTIIYTNIYRMVSNHRTPGEQQQLKTDDSRNRRALVTTLLILGSFIICWVPVTLFQVIMMIRVRNDSEWLERDPEFLIKLVQTDNYLLSLLLLNSICDPIIYTVRTYEVQLGYKRLCRLCFPRPLLVRTRSACNATSSSLVKLPNENLVRTELVSNGSNGRQRYDACPL